MATATYDVIGVGNAIVDVLSPADEAFLAKHGLAKGMMTMREDAIIKALNGEIPFSEINTLGGVFLSEGIEEEEESAPAS